MPGRAAKRPGTVAVVPNTEIADPTVDRAVSQVRDAVRALQSKAPTTVNIVGNDHGASITSGGSVAVSSTVVKIADASSDRCVLYLKNTGAGDARIGGVDVAPATGFPLAAGAELRFDAPACVISAVYAIREAAADTSILVVEVL